MQTSHSFPSFTLDDFINQFSYQWNFLPSDIFCERTGHKIGTMSENELLLSFKLLPHSLGIEKCIEEHCVKMMASARPSTIFNYIRKETYSEILELAPMHLASYLLSRNFSFSPFNNKNDNFFEQMLQKIAIAKHCETLDFNREDNLQLVYLLITYDRMFSLASSPIKNFQSVDEFTSRPIKETLDLIGEQIVLFRKKFDDDNKKARMQLKAIQGNLQLKEAFAKVYREKKPLTAKQSLRVDIAIMIADLLDETSYGSSDKLRAEISNVVPPKPEPKPLASFKGLKLRVYSGIKS